MQSVSESEILRLSTRLQATFCQDNESNPGPGINKYYVEILVEIPVR